MYDNLRVNWAPPIPAFLSLVCVPFPFLFYRYGLQIWGHYNMPRNQNVLWICFRARPDVLNLYRWVTKKNEISNLGDAIDLSCICNKLSYTF